MARLLARGASWLGRRRRLLFTTGLSGALFAAALPGGVGSWLTWVCLVPVLWALVGDDLLLPEAMLIGWLFGLTALLSVYSCLIATLQRFGDLPLPLALLGYGLLCAGQATAYAVWAGLTHLCRRARMPFVLAAPLALVLVEWLYPSVFPTYLANGLHGQTLAVQSLDLAGPLGLSFLVAASGAVMAEGLALLLSRRPVRLWRAVLGLTLLHAGNLGYGAHRMSEIDARVASAARHLRVGLVQTNQGRFAGPHEVRQGVLRHREQSLEAIRAGAELVVWPESAYNFVITASMMDVSDSVLGPVDRPVIFGGLRLEPGASGRRLFHSAFLSDTRGRLSGYYDKQRLVLMGEYVPLGERFPWLYGLSPNSGRFSAGTDARVLSIGDLRFAVTICYEDLFPDLVGDLMGQAPQLLVNLSNDVWFGDTREPRAHLAAASFRAIEQRRFLVRATNTGVSAIVDPVGRVLAQTPLFARANLVGQVALLENRTFYGRSGDWLGGLALATLLAWSVTHRSVVGRGSPRL